MAVSAGDVAVGGIVVAAGMGQRLGTPSPKALLEVGGIPLVRHAVRTLVAAGLGSPVVVHPADHRSGFADALRGDEVTLVPGGVSRTDSVRAGVAALGPGPTIVAVHDAARPLVPVDVVRRTVSAVTGDVLAAAPAVRVADTLKQVDGDTVVATVDRTGLRGVQTPQVFPREVLDDVLACPGDATDELTLVERGIAEGRLLGRVVVVAGSAFGMKVTFPEDLAIVEALARVQQEAAT